MLPQTLWSLITEQLNYFLMKFLWKTPERTLKMQTEPLKKVDRRTWHFFFRTHVQKQEDTISHLRLLTELYTKYSNASLPHVFLWQIVGILQSQSMIKHAEWMVSQKLSMIFLVERNLNACNPTKEDVNKSWQFEHCGEFCRSCESYLVLCSFKP